MRAKSEFLSSAGSVGLIIRMSVHLVRRIKAKLPIRYLGRPYRYGHIDTILLKSGRRWLTYAGVGRRG